MTTLKQLHTMKTRGEKIAVLTCYDASFATLMEAAGVEVLLVGDSLGMVLKGDQDTLSVTMQDMIDHTRSVASTSKSALIITDMPYQSDNTANLALRNARQLIEAGAHVIKLEGYKIEVIRHLVLNQISVCGHLGFTPQSVRELGGYKVQGRDATSAKKILDDALSLQQAGISMLVLEMVPAALAKQITAQLSIPVIGIGAGVDCDGQVLVLHDALGMYPGKTLKFTRNFLRDSSSIPEALSAYVEAVKSNKFPAQEHSF